MLYRKDDKVRWTASDDERTSIQGVLVRKTQDANRRNLWVLKLDDGRVVQAYENEFKPA